MRSATWNFNDYLTSNPRPTKPVLKSPWVSHRKAPRRRRDVVRGIWTRSQRTSVHQSTLSSSRLLSQQRISLDLGSSTVLSAQNGLRASTAVWRTSKEARIREELKHLRTNHIHRRKPKQLLVSAPTMVLDKQPRRILRIWR